MTMSDDTCGRYDPSPDDGDSVTFELEQEEAAECSGPVSPDAPAEGERDDEDDAMGAEGVDDRA
jgi:hypothetical protein